MMRMCVIRMKPASMVSTLVNLTLNRIENQQKKTFQPNSNR